ncbi:hypothetical protein DERF_006191 [Dermatophagoides farinae]|uniref:MAP kinase-activating death domain protein n=1 Tax=Dermatophagoides farinae TaxID=6954 RepID=A0A922LBY8_DERFA|nr:hypothetical protein DERF_006191 [Dermatophagoides farinae]
MADCVKKYFSPRLLDYIVIVGTRTPSATQSVQLPQLLRRYPPEDHKDFPLSPDVVFFCQPEGCINTDIRRLSQRDTNSFVFALTEKDTSRVRYGICMNFHLRTPYCSTKSSDDDENSNSGDGSRSHRCLSLISLCIISHHPFFSTFRECLTTLRKMIFMFSQRNRDKKHRRDLVWTLLTTRFEPDFTKILPENVLNDVCEIETWCLRLLSSPVPVPGKTKVELEILDPEIRPPLVLALPDHTRFSLIDFPLHLPLELLGVETCLKVITMIMMEHKIVIQSRDYNALSMSVMAFVTIIYPFEYMFPVIPLLPTCMNSAEQLLLAPTPFIIGVPSSFLLYKKNFKLPDDVWLVDLDTNKIIKPTAADDLPPLPEPEAMVKFFNSNGILLNFSEYTRTIRLFPRPVVAFQINSFLHSRPKSSVFLTKFVQTQAVEFFAEWSLCPDNVAFIRVQNGVYDPSIIGDKAKWYSHQLDAINFRVCSGGANCKLTKIFKESIEKEMNADSDDDDDDEDDDENDDDSVDEPSTSSSYSSLNEFVEQMCNANRINSEYLNTLRDPSNSSFTLCDTSSVFHPPESIQLVSIPDGFNDTVKTNTSGEDVDIANTVAPVITARTKIRRKSSIQQPQPEIHKSSSSSSNSDSDDDDQQHEFKTTSLYEKTNITLPDLNQITSNLNKVTSESTETVEPITEISRSSTPKALENISYTSSSSIPNISPSNSLDKSSGTSTPTLTKAISISSVFTRSQSQTHRDSISGHSILDRLTHEAKDMAREAKAVAKEVVAKPAAQAGKKKFLAKLQDFGEPMKGQAKEFWRHSKEENEQQQQQQQQQTQQSNVDNNYGLPLSSSSSSIISSMSSDFNGLADKTAGMLSGFFSKSNLAKVKERTQPFGPFPKGKKGLIEKSNLIRHTSAQNQQQQQQQQTIDQKNQNHSDNQLFLKDSINSVLEGEGIGWLKLSRLKKLMEDEQYRALVIQLLNKAMPRKIGPDDHIEDVQIPRNVWKGLLKVINAMIYGLEQNYFHHASSNSSSSGMASTFAILEIAHTHFWVKEMTAEEKASMAATTATCSQRSTPFGSNENLSKLSNVEQTIGDNQTSHELQSESKDTLGSIPKSNETSWKRNLMLNQLISFESDVLSDASPSCNASDAGSLTVNPIFGTKLFGSNSFRSTCSDTDIEGLQGRQSRTSSVWSSKSSISAGFRYHGGALIGSIPMEIQRYYLFESVIGNNRSNLWDQMQFWEDVFLDAVSQERDLIGMDQGPGEMMSRYHTLSEIDKKRLEHEEDRLLATFLYNMTAFMIMVNIDRTEIKRKCRRLLGKCHIGLVYSAEINEVLDQIDYLHGNDIDLKPLSTRQIHRQTFTVHMGTDSMGDMMFMEVRDDGLILRSINGIIIERWWYERLVNMTYSPKNKVLCLWRRNGAHTQLHKYYTRKCKDLYYCIKESMERAVQNGTGTLPGTELGGEFPVQDMKSSEGGLLQVCMEGVGLLFANSKFFIRLENIRKCFTQKGGIFVIEEFNPKTRQIIQRKFRSQMADQICYAVLCVFSYIAAGLEQHKRQQQQQQQQLQQQHGKINSKNLGTTNLLQHQQSSTTTTTSSSSTVISAILVPTSQQQQQQQQQQHSQNNKHKYHNLDSS